MDSLRDLAGRLDEAAATLAATGREAARTGPPATALGADAPGRPGELGRALYDQWIAATGARAREAAGVAAQLTDAATALRAALVAYADTDEAARRWHTGAG